MTKRRNQFMIVLYHFHWKKPGLLGEMADPRSGLEMYKMSLEQVMSQFKDTVTGQR